MTQPDRPLDDAAMLLAELHAARDLARSVVKRRGSTAVRASELWAHARRAPGDPVSLAVERAIRTDPGIGQRYRTMLASMSVAHAPFAAAASDGAIMERRVGALTLSIREGEDGSPPLLVMTGVGERAPRLIEIATDQDALRLALPEPISGAIILALDPSIPEIARFAALLRNPRSEIFLV
jgi:hypothetical protein